MTKKTPKNFDKNYERIILNRQQAAILFDFLDYSHTPNEKLKRLAEHQKVSTDNYNDAGSQ